MGLHLGHVIADGQGHRRGDRERHVADRHAFHRHAGRAVTGDNQVLGIIAIAVNEGLHPRHQRRRGGSIAVMHIQHHPPRGLVNGDMTHLLNHHPVGFNHRQPRSVLQGTQGAARQAGDVGGKAGALLGIGFFQAPIQDRLAIGAGHPGRRHQSTAIDDHAQAADLGIGLRAGLRGARQGGDLEGTRRDGRAG